MPTSSLTPASQGATATAVTNITSLDAKYQATCTEVKRKVDVHIKTYISKPGTRLMLEEKVIKFLQDLKDKFKITPSNKEDTQIDEALRSIFACPENGFTDAAKQRAEALYREWEAADWGATEGTAEDEDEDEVEQQTPTAVAPTSTSRRRVNGPPSPNHSIWGRTGIMHGLTLGKNGVSFALDVRYRLEQRPAKPGRNGLWPGDWYPYQMSALYHGAHGSSQAGIAGNEGYGAISIVLSAMYRDVDIDAGDTIYYSAPGSHENEDPTRPRPSKMTDYLRMLIESGNAVRVLRRADSSSSSAGRAGSSRFAPNVGIRYDGLYQVDREEPPLHNHLGGMFNRFVLERCPGQESLATIQARSPTAQQVRDYGKVWDLW